MRLCLRLAVPVILLVAVAMTLVCVRTETVRAGNRLNSLYSQKRELEKACYRLELSIASLKCPQRLREHAVSLKSPGPEELSPEGSPRPRPLLAGKAR